MIKELLFVAESKRSECEEIIEDTRSQMDMLVDDYLTRLFSINNEIKETGMYAGIETSIGTVCPYVKKEKRYEFGLVYLEYRKYTKSRVDNKSVISRRYKNVAARHKTAIATESLCRTFVFEVVLQCYLQFFNLFHRHFAFNCLCHTFVFG